MVPSSSSHLLNRGERAVLIQSVCEFAAFVLYFCYYYVFKMFNTVDCYISFQMQDFYQFILWIGECGTGPVLYLTMNRILRERAFQLLNWKTEGTHVTRVNPSAITL